MKFCISLILFICTSFSFRQLKDETYYISEKGVTITIKQRNKKTKIAFKKDHDFYFTAKNDSIALIQEIIKGKPGKVEEHKIASSFDTINVKRHTYINGKRTIKIEKLILKKVY